MVIGSVLIVDHDSHRLEAASQSLRTHHYKTVEAASASAALIIALQEKPDLILLRLGLGLEVFHDLAEAAESSGTFIAVFIERSFASERRNEVLSLKAAAFLNEDLPQDELIASIAALLRQKRVVDELKRSIGSKAARNSETKNKSAPLRDRSPELYRALLHRYEEAVKHALQHRIYKMTDDAFEPFRQIAEELFLANATARDALELHYQTLRRIAPAPDAPRAQAYLEVGRTTIIGLMGDLLACYRDACKNNTFESKTYTDGLQEQWSERAP